MGSSAQNVDMTNAHLHVEALLRRPTRRVYKVKGSRGVFEGRATAGVQKVRPARRMAQGVEFGHGSDLAMCFVWGLNPAVWLSTELV